MQTAAARLCLGIVTAILLALAPPAHAHRASTAGAGLAAGISIPSLTHGEMAVIADYRGAIFDAAARRVQTDQNFRRLFNFAKIQYTVCMWGLMPGGISDEQSPFNECSHAYLAATRALLMRMAGMPGDNTAARALVDRIAIEMLETGASFQLCQYSGEPFNTAELIYPRWSGMPFHLPSLATLAAFALVLASGALALARWLRGGPVNAVAGQPGAGPVAGGRGKHVSFQLTQGAAFRSPLPTKEG